MSKRGQRGANDCAAFRKWREVLRDAPSPVAAPSTPRATPARYKVRCRLCGQVIVIESGGGLLATNEWLEEQIGRHEATCTGPIVAGKIVN